MLNSHPNCEHKPSDRQTIRTPQNGVQVPLIGGLVVHDVELHGVDLAIILVLGPLGVVIIIIIIIIIIITLVLSEPQWKWSWNTLYRSARGPPLSPTLAPMSTVYS